MLVSEIKRCYQLCTGQQIDFALFARFFQSALGTRADMYRILHVCARWMCVGGLMGCRSALHGDVSRDTQFVRVMDLDIGRVDTLAIYSLKTKTKFKSESLTDAVKYSLSNFSCFALEMGTTAGAANVPIYAARSKKMREYMSCITTGCSITTFRQRAVFSQLSELSGNSVRRVSAHHPENHRKIIRSTWISLFQLIASTNWSVLQANSRTPKINCTSEYRRHFEWRMKGEIAKILRFYPHKQIVLFFSKQSEQWRCSVTESAVWKIWLIS